MTKLQTLKERYFPSDASYTLKNQLGYCAGIFGNCMGQDSVESISEKFCRKFMGVNDTQVTISGNLKLAVGFLAGFVSGYILDTPVRDSRKTPARIFTGIMPLPFMISTILLFVVPSGDPVRNFHWMLPFLLLFRASDSFYDASLNTLSLRITDRPEDRKSFFTVGTFASALGGMLPDYLISVLVGNTQDLSKQQGYYFWVTLIFSVIGVVMMVVPFFTMEERVRLTERPEKQKLAWDRQTLSSLLHNRAFIVVEVATLFEQIRQIPYKLIPFIYEDVLGALKLRGVMDPLSGTLSYAGLAAVPFLTRRFAPRTLLSGGFAYTGIFYSLLGLLGIGFTGQKIHRRRVIVGILIGLAGMPNNAITASKKIVVSDSTDYMEWYAEKHYGRPIHAEGFISAAQSMLGSVFDLIRSNIYYFWFRTLNYQENRADAAGKALPQSEFTMRGMYRMFVLLGVIGNFCAALTYLFDNYHGKRKEEIAAQLAEMREKRQKIVEARSEEIAASAD